MASASEPDFFVVCDDDLGECRDDLVECDDEEDLPQPRERQWSAPRRLRLPAAGALLLLAVLAVVLHGRAAPKPHVVALPRAPVVHAAASSASTTPHLLHDTNGLVGERARVRFPSAGTDAEITTNRGVAALCPPPRSCTRTILLPAPVVRAILDAFPGARVRFATTVAYISHADGRTSLGYRVLRAVSPDREIDINVVPQSAGDHAETGSVADAVGAVVFTQREVKGYSVQVIVHMSGAVAHPTALLRRLSTDRRLLALP